MEDRGMCRVQILEATRPAKHMPFLKQKNTRSQTKIILYVSVIKKSRNMLLPWGRCIMPTLMPEMRSGMP